MRTTFVEILLSRAARIRAGHLTRERMLPLLGLTAIVLLAAALRFANLEVLGYANHYYTAAVKSMLQSWHSFFFVAAEPGGSVSVDKPPLGLWIQASSAYFLGVNGLGVLLPEIAAGIASVIVVYHLAQRRFGAVAGLLAALALAITPVVVATDRNNTIDSLLILTLLVAAWAFIKATESGKLRCLLLGATLVGLGFNIKMLQAYLPLPAFYALYALGSSEPLRRKLGKLTLATALLLSVSLSWAVAVELTPAERRPYVGSSGNNSVFSLIVGYNGMERLLGMGAGAADAPAGGGNRTFQDDGRRPGDGQARPPTQAGGARPQLPQGTGDGAPPQIPQDAGDGALPQPPQGFTGMPGRTGAPGGFNIGQAGLLRLFTAPLSKEASWLLPLGLLGALLLALRSRLRWPLDARHQAVVLWGGWLLTGGAFFSIAGFFHEYYLAMLGAPLAALAGLGIGELRHLRRERPWLAVGLLLAGAGVTLALQLATATAYVGAAWWLGVGVVLFAAGAAVAIAATALKPLRRAAPAGFALVVAALLITPGIWSGLTARNASANQSLPAAYSGEGSSGPAARGESQVNQALLDYLEPRTQDTTYLMAVPSSMQGADYVLATGRPVLYMGGFNGQDQVLTVEQLAELVAAGKLRYILWGGMGGQAELAAWITSHGTLVEGFGTATSNFGAPDGTATPGGAGGGPGLGREGMQVALYELKA
ncbi:MAG TPA: glycosyltransferase family 39 protein [Anaerolineae bacterium]|nr:glycosyltransferase family 39 protein [Anaerolineae bacterium]HOR00092.1 glycosyltransferase family 39 protein [Anaerolineae bacterium]HPL26880.1 glycosyltransferase family 39 protein [Anaerolineae bacterium]